MKDVECSFICHLISNCLSAFVMHLVTLSFALKVDLIIVIDGLKVVCSQGMWSGFSEYDNKMILCHFQVLVLVESVVYRLLLESLLLLW